MINFISGNILKSDCEAIVNTTNTIGVMGAGLALAFKKAYPKMYEDYRRDCFAGLVQTGKMHVWPIPTESNPKYIVNFSTKQNWRNPSKIEWIVSGLTDLVKTIKILDIKSIAIPALGCKNGGLNWTDVKNLIVNCHDSNWVDIRVDVYQP